VGFAVGCRDGCDPAQRGKRTPKLLIRAMKSVGWDLGSLRWTWNRPKDEAAPWWAVDSKPNSHQSATSSEKR